MKFYIIRTFYILLLVPTLCYAQDKTSDELFSEARIFAFDSVDYVKSRELCDKALQQAPEYFDVLIFKARTYSWEKKYEEARQILQKVIEDSPSEKDAYLALLDVELWTNNFNEVIKLSDQALNYFAKNTEILIRKVKALHRLGENKEALKLVEQILEIESGDKEA